MPHRSIPPKIQEYGLGLYSWFPMFDVIVVPGPGRCLDLHSYLPSDGTLSRGAKPALEGVVIQIGLTQLVSPHHPQPSEGDVVAMLPLATQRTFQNRFPRRAFREGSENLDF